MARSLPALAARFGGGDGCCGVCLFSTDLSVRMTATRLWMVAARSMLLGVRHRLHFTSSHGRPPLIACPIVGEGCAGPPVLHIFSFQLWHARLSASRISASPTRRFLCALGQNACHRPGLHKLLAQGLPVTAGQGCRVMFRGHGLSRHVGWRIICRRCGPGLQDPGLLGHAREIRDRVLVDGRRLGFSRLPDFRQVAAGQDRHEARCHPSIKALPAAAGKSSYRWGPEQFRPLLIAGGDKQRPIRQGNLLASRGVG
jgi:hypothetical protein